MKEKVTFREYTLPIVPSSAGEEERGEFLGSFSKDFEGRDVTEINLKINQFLKEHGEREKVDVRVWHGQ